MISTSERTCRFKSSARRCTKPGCRLLKDHPWSLLEGDKQITARVNGHAVGLRATIALLCDIIIAAENA
jgi:enoyl-CoA hydratase/carnithine racemase